MNRVLLFSRHVINSKITNFEMQIFSRAFASKKTRNDNPFFLDLEKPKRKKNFNPPRINLIGPDGKSMGLKTNREAHEIAHKNNWILIPDKLSTKVETFRLIPQEKLDQYMKGEEIFSKEDSEQVIEEVSHESHDDKEASETTGMQPGKMRVRPPKNLFFKDKLSDHDLMVKINQVAKWTEGYRQTNVRIYSPSQESDKLKNILSKFEERFHHPDKGTKINQIRATPLELKFSVVRFDPLKKSKVSQSLSTDRSSTDLLSSEEKN